MNSRDSAAKITIPRQRIPVIGIVGGIGSGKSAVANWVASHANIIVINADVLGHESLQADVVKNALREKFGDEIFDAQGNVQRAAIAGKVFGRDEQHALARKELEQVVHPEIRRRIAEQIEKAVADHRDAVLLDAAVLLETGWREQVDLVAYIDTPDDVRLARVKARSGWSEEELRRREASQWSLADKRRQSDLIVENSSDLETAGRNLLESLQHCGLIKRDQSASLK